MNDGSEDTVYVNSRDGEERAAEIARSALKNIVSVSFQRKLLLSKYWQ